MAEITDAEIEALVKEAYNKGFMEGMRDHTSRSGGKPWSEVSSKWAAKIAALTAAAAVRAPEPDGWKLVPVEPTQEMLSAAGKYADYCAVHNYGGPPDADGTWEAMLSASPPPPSAPVEPSFRDELATTLDKWAAVLDIPSGTFVNDELRAAAAALRAPVEPVGWRDIASAPCDDAVVLLYWLDGNASIEDLDHDSDPAWWKARGATHWMPFPASPPPPSPSEQKP